MHQQCSLFADQAVTLVHDAEGGIVYHPACVPQASGALWLATLLAQTPWRRLQRPMYERVVEVPRLVASVALRDPARPPCIDAALAQVQAVAPAPYTHVGLNLYRDGRDSVAPHGDRQAELEPGWPIAIVSLGVPRDMLIRALAGGASQRITLEPGSLLRMSHASQRTHLHAVPKCAQALGPRISLAFRVRRSPP